MNQLEIALRIKAQAEGEDKIFALVREAFGLAFAHDQCQNEQGKRYWRDEHERDADGARQCIEQRAGVVVPYRAAHEECDYGKQGGPAGNISTLWRRIFGVTRGRHG